MSFSSDLKMEIMNSQYKNSCCRRALLQGVFSAKAFLNDNGNIALNIENTEFGDFIASLIKEFYGIDADISSSPRGGRCKQVSFKSKSLKNFLINIENAAEFYNEKCTYCKTAFFRGLYFACGRTTDPSKQFCLEFSVGNRIKMFDNLFKMYGFEMKSAVRAGEKLLYSKNSTVIEDFFAMAELHDAAFTVMNIKIANALKNDANRIRNFDTVNISKAVDAAASQYALIKDLYDRKLLSQLPEELAQTARLRLEHPDMSLSQLAIHSIPPISKSGITHRMKKIMKLGGELLDKKQI